MAKNRKLGKTTAQRKAMLRTQVTDLLVNEKITTTLARAKETQAIANSLIALAIKEKDNFQMEDKKIVRAKRDTNGNKVTELVKSKNGNEYLKVVKEEVTENENKEIDKVEQEIKEEVKEEKTEDAEKTQEENKQEEGGQE